MSRRLLFPRTLLVFGVIVAAALTSVGITHAGTIANPAPSSGCGIPAPPTGHTTQSFSISGRSGTYIRDIPAAATTGDPMPLVFDLHGYLEPAPLEHLYTGLADYGDTHGFITITPQTGNSPLPIWDTGSTTGDTTDTRYLSGLITHLESTLCIDRRRVYVAGLSMGAMTAMAVACQLSDRIAAVAAVAGLETFPWCHPTRPVPVIAFHGTADPFLAYDGGLGPLTRSIPFTLTEALPSIPGNAAAWAGYDRCRPHPTDRQVSTDVTLRTFDCPQRGTVELYTIAGGGHTWPGVPPTVAAISAPIMGRTTQSINANQLIWRFFEEHPLPA
jgi:polyhydroxybutyrate depolymerase